jgi:adenylate cyclase
LSWQPDTGVSTGAAGFELLDADNFLNSPVVHVYNTGVALRRRLAAADCPCDFPILDEFRAQGLTDYLASPLHFTNGEIHVATWATRQPGGFTETQFAGIESVVAPLARLTEVYALRRTAGNLLDAYVGREAGERILAGRIRRGDSEAIHAVIWLSDMRGFTALSDTLPPPTLIRLLNQYFDCQVAAIGAHGGEVLKFMGDGLLAIFALGGNGEDAAVRCRAALAAGREVQAKIAGSDTLAALAGGAPPGFGLALHLGEVLYGNVGGGGRLDFTCIGPAVNLAARIEKLTGETGRAILASADFARYCGLRELVAVGEFSLRGFAARQSVFGLADEIERRGR